MKRLFFALLLASLVAACSFDAGEGTTSISGALVSEALDDEGLGGVEESLAVGNVLTPRRPLVAQGVFHTVVVRDGALVALGDNRHGQLCSAGGNATVGRRVPNVTGVVAVAAGLWHTVFLKNDGTVWACGRNDRGQLGVSNITSTSTPVQILGGVHAIAAGHASSYALQASGNVVAWGANDNGQLGDGTTFDHAYPSWVLDKTTGMPITAETISAGVAHAVAARGDGEVLAWGRNGEGELGGSVATYETQAIRTRAFGPPREVSAGGYFTLVLRQDGTVAGAGHDFYGQLGDAAGVNRSTPVTIPGLTGIRHVAAGMGHALAIDAQRRVLAWGKGDRGTLGVPSGNRFTPAVVPGLAAITEVAAGYETSFALSGMGSAWAFGDNGFGQLGDGSVVDRTTPAAVVGFFGAKSRLVAAADAHSLVSLPNGGVLDVGPRSETAAFIDGKQSRRLIPIANVAALADGGRHALALDTSGSVFAWGANDQGQLGNGVTSSAETFTPQAVALPPMLAVAAGDRHSIALDEHGRVYTWRANDRGQLGTGTTTPRSVPAPVVSISGIVAVYARANQSFALRWDGALYCFGDGRKGQLGLSGVPQQFVATPTIQPFADVRAVASGTEHTLVVRADGTVWTFGDNSMYQLGTASVNPFFPAPVQVNGIVGATDVLAGGAFSAAVTPSGVLAWGANGAGQLDRGTLSARESAPAAMLDASGATDIALGATHGVFRRSDGSVTRFGYDFAADVKPVRVPSIALASAIAAGDRHAIVLAGGLASAWGDNTFGQIGNGTTTTALSPVTVLGGVTAIAAGMRHSVAARPDNVYTWGDNASGELGSGPFGSGRTTPAGVGVGFLQVGTLAGATAVAAGDGFSLAAMNQRAYGFGRCQQAGFAGGDCSIPQPTTDVFVSQLSASGLHALSRNASLVVTWGSNGAGQLGDGTFVSRAAPSQVAGVTDIVDVAAGGAHSLALRGDGSMLVWGDGSSGQLGDGTTIGKPLPTATPSYGFVQLGAGAKHSVAVKGDGTVWAWGSNSASQLGTVFGDGGIASRVVPAPIAGLSGAVEARAGTGFTLVRKADGTVWAVGLTLLARARAVEL